MARHLSDHPRGVTPGHDSDGMPGCERKGGPLRSYGGVGTPHAADDSPPRETEGYFHTAPYLSQPPEDTAAFPFTTLTQAPTQAPCPTKR